MAFEINGLNDVQKKQFEGLKAISNGNESMLRALAVAAGLVKEPTILIVTKMNAKNEPYKVITLKGTQVAFGVKNGRKILDNIEQLAQVVKELEAEEAAKGKK